MQLRRDGPTLKRQQEGQEVMLPAVKYKKFALRIPSNISQQGSSMKIVANSEPTHFYMIKKCCSAVIDKEDTLIQPRALCREARTF